MTTTMTQVRRRMEGQPALSGAQLAEAERLDSRNAAGIDPGSTLVVSGFWRSGTTWLQESLSALLGAKTIFEPFHYRVPLARELFRYYGLCKKPAPVRELFMPCCCEPNLAAQPFLQRYFDAALRGSLTGEIVRVLRTGVDESQCTRVVTKFTRGHLSLAAAHASFGMPLVHVRRDPRSVIASARMTSWSWLFDHLDLPEQLLQVKDGRRRLFAPHAAALREYNTDTVSRMAAYWAMTENVMHQAFGLQQKERAVIVCYEALSLGGAAALLELLEQLGFESVDEAGLHTVGRDSFSTSVGRQGMTAEQRVRGWQRVLSMQEAQRIVDVVCELGMERGLYE